MRVLVAGSTGYMGAAVLRELVGRRVDVVALVRPGRSLPESIRAVVTVVEADVVEDADWSEQIPAVDAVISCLASRNGAPDDAQKVDYDANRRLLDWAERYNVGHFVLLSAICVQKPRLAFQREKLRFERLLHGSSVPGTIIRATAFFRSLVGQIDRVKAGKPFLLFGNGELTACKPISDRDLARFIVNQLDEHREGTVVRPIGGTGPAIAPAAQAVLLCNAANVPLRTRSLPPQMFDWFRWLLTPLALVSTRFAKRVEFLRIAKFYATESMLCWDHDDQRYDADGTPEFGDDTLAAFYQRVLSGSESAPERGEHRLF
jgi:divinyl chlorophyllide a 8-vinyl-reductase